MLVNQTVMSVILVTPLEVALRRLTTEVSTAKPKVNKYCTTLRLITQGCQRKSNLCATKGNNLHTGVESGSERSPFDRNKVNSY